VSREAAPRCGSSSAGDFGVSVSTLTFGTEQLREVRAISSIQTALQFGDGLLPTSLFHSLYINNRENFVVFNPRIGGSELRH
jgi:hypothetical protein